MQKNRRTHPLRQITARTALALALAITALSATAQSRYIERAEVQEFANQVAINHNLDRNAILGALAQIEALPRVIELVRPPSQPGVRSWQRYRERFLDRTRINGGVSFWQTHREALARAEARYGVPAEIIVAIIGVETVYGRNTGSFQTASALATLAFDYPPRAELFRKELEALFVLASEQGRNPLDYRGSYAGALGVPQFLPSSIRRYAVDFDQSGDVDLRVSTLDAIGSVANYLAENGWQKGGLIAERAQLEASTLTESWLENGITPRWTAAQFEAGGIRTSRPIAAQYERDNAALIDLITPDQATEYWLGFQNFYVITRYNRSSFYAMSVMQLAQAVREKMDLAGN